MIPSDIPSEDLAALIIDELVDAGIVDKHQFEDAVAIATEDINARKYLRDYWCAHCSNQAFTNHEDAIAPHKV